MDIKYPDVSVQLTGRDGNGFGIMARVSMALKRAGVPEEEVAIFRDTALAGDYDHLLQTCMEWVDVQ